MSLRSARVAVLGASGTGKSSFIRFACHDTFDDAARATIHMQESRKTLGAGVQPSEVLEAVFVEDGGHSLASSLPTLCRNAACVMLVYDITNRSSFEIATELLHTALAATGTNSFAMLIGCKGDKESAREVPITVGEEFATKNNLFFIETSSIDGTNIALTLNILRIRLIHAIKSSTSFANLPHSTTENGSKATAALPLYHPDRSTALASSVASSHAAAKVSYGIPTPWSTPSTPQQQAPADSVQNSIVAPASMSLDSAAPSSSQPSHQAPPRASLPVPRSGVETAISLTSVSDSLGSIRSILGRRSDTATPTVTSTGAATGPGAGAGLGSTMTTTPVPWTAPQATAQGSDDEWLGGAAQRGGPPPPPPARQSGIPLPASHSSGQPHAPPATTITPAFADVDSQVAEALRLAQQFEQASLTTTATATAGNAGPAMAVSPAPVNPAQTTTVHTPDGALSREYEQLKALLAQYDAETTSAVVVPTSQAEQPRPGLPVDHVPVVTSISLMGPPRLPNPSADATVHLDDEEETADVGPRTGRGGVAGELRPLPHKDSADERDFEAGSEYDPWRSRSNSPSASPHSPTQRGGAQDQQPGGTAARRGKGQAKRGRPARRARGDQQHAESKRSNSPPTGATGGSTALTTTGGSGGAGYSRRTVLDIDVFLGGRCVGQIEVRRGDNAYTLAHKFIRDRGLQISHVIKLSKLIASKIQAYCEEQNKKEVARRRKQNHAEVLHWRRKTTQPAPFSFATDKREQLKLADEESEARPLIGRLNVEVGPGKTASLPIRLADDPKVLVANFKRTHGLRRGVAGVIYDNIVQRMRDAEARLGAERVAAAVAQKQQDDESRLHQPNGDATSVLSPTMQPPQQQYQQGYTGPAQVRHEAPARRSSILTPPRPISFGATTSIPEHGQPEGSSVGDEGTRRYRLPDPAEEGYDPDEARRVAALGNGFHVTMQSNPASANGSPRFQTGTGGGSNSVYTTQAPVGTMPAIHFHPAKGFGQRGGCGKAGGQGGATSSLDPESLEIATRVLPSAEGSTSGSAAQSVGFSSYDPRARALAPPQFHQSSSPSGIPETIQWEDCLEPQPHPQQPQGRRGARPDANSHHSMYTRRPNAAGTAGEAEAQAAQVAEAKAQQRKRRATIGGAPSQSIMRPTKASTARANAIKSRLSAAAEDDADAARPLSGGGGTASGNRRLSRRSSAAASKPSSRRSSTDRPRAVPIPVAAGFTRDEAGSDSYSDDDDTSAHELTERQKALLLKTLTPAEVPASARDSSGGRVESAYAVRAPSPDTPTAAPTSKLLRPHQSAPMVSTAASGTGKPPAHRPSTAVAERAGTASPPAEPDTASMGVRRKLSLESTAVEANESAANTRPNSPRQPAPAAVSVVEEERTAATRTASPRSEPSSVPPAKPGSALARAERLLAASKARMNRKPNTSAPAAAPDPVAAPATRPTPALPPAPPASTTATPTRPASAAATPSADGAGSQPRRSATPSWARSPAVPTTNTRPAAAPIPARAPEPDDANSARDTHTPSADPSPSGSAEGPAPPASARDQAVLSPVASRASTPANQPVTPLESATPWFNLDLNIGGGQRRRLVVRKGIDSTVMAKAFADEHQLPAKVVPRLVKVIDHNVAIHQERQSGRSFR